MSDSQRKFWMSKVPRFDDFGEEISSEFVDGRTIMGPWATMAPSSWRKYGVGSLGLGLGQLYRLTDDGRWLKMEG